MEKFHQLFSKISQCNCRYCFLYWFQQNLCHNWVCYDEVDKCNSLKRAPNNEVFVSNFGEDSRIPQWTWRGTKIFLRVWACVCVRTAQPVERTKMAEHKLNPSEGELETASTPFNTRISRYPLQVAHVQLALAILKLTCESLAIDLNIRWSN